MKQLGYSLIEVMIAMALTLLILSFLITLFQGIRETSAKTNNLIILQEIGRTVFQFLRQDLHGKDAKILNPSSIPNSVLLQNPPGSYPILLAAGNNKIVYWLSTIPRFNTRHIKELELNRRNLSLNIHNPVAIIDGIKSLNVEYGQLQNGNLIFKHATNIHDWSNVCLLKIELTAAHLMQKKVFNFILGVPTCNQKVSS